MARARSDTRYGFRMNPVAPSSNISWASHPTVSPEAGRTGTPGSIRWRAVLVLRKNETSWDLTRANRAVQRAGECGKRIANARIDRAHNPPAMEKPAANPKRAITAPRVAAETANPP